MWKNSTNSGDHICVRSRQGRQCAPESDAKSIFRHFHWRQECRPHCDRPVRRSCAENGKELPGAVNWVLWLRIQGVEVPPGHSQFHDPRLMLLKFRRGTKNKGSLFLFFSSKNFSDYRKKDKTVPLYFFGLSGFRLVTPLVILSLIHLTPHFLEVKIKN